MLICTYHCGLTPPTTWVRRSFLDALGHRRSSAARRRLLQGLALVVVAAVVAAHQPGLQAQGRAEAVAATGTAPALALATDSEVWAQFSGWLVSHGAWGKYLVLALVIVGAFVANAQNFTAIGSWFPQLWRWLRPKSKEIRPPSPVPISSGANVGVLVSGNAQGITNSGSISVGGNQTVIAAGPGSPVESIAGDKHVHHYPPAKPNPQLPQSHTPHNLPDRNTDPSRFVGRNVQRDKLLELISPAGSRVFLTGMGGVVKSELALQVARSALDQFPGGVVQLDGRQGFEAMATELIGFVRRSFADLLPKEGSPEELLGLCWNRWPARANPPEPVLLVLDDLPGSAKGQSSEDRLCQGLPPRFRRLITRREAASAGVASINLEVLQRPDALRLLSLQAGAQGEQRIGSQSEAADALCEAVGDLPLALVLLGARLHNQRDLGVAALLADLQAKGAEAKALRQAHPELGARLGVVESLLISWEPLSEPAKELAILLAAMAAAVIPWELVEACRREDQELVEGSAFGDAQAELVEAQLLQRVGDNRYQLHPLVRQFLALQAQAMESLQEQWRRMLAQAVAAICREKFEQTMPLALQAEVEPYVAHIEWVAQHYSDAFSDDDLAWPCSALGRLRENQANYPAAEHWYRHGLELCDQRFGPDHPATSTALNNLAVLLKATNRLAEAEPMYRRALAIDEASYGLDHPRVATRLNNLAQLLKATSRLAEAEPMYRRALGIAEASLGRDHPYVASCLNNLAQLLQTTNRLAEAEPLMRRALQIDKASYGQDHPAVARDLNNLARLLQNSNRLVEAELLMRRAFGILLSSLSLEHPNSQTILENYIEILQDQGLSEEAIQAKLASLFQQD
jgi:tetratricopeptide (TPR) repeat protein